MGRSPKTKQKQTNSQTAPPSTTDCLSSMGVGGEGGISLLRKSFSAHVGMSAGEASAVLTTLLRVHGCHIPVLARRHYHLSATPVLRLLKSRLRTTGSPLVCPHLTGRGKEQQVLPRTEQAKVASPMTSCSACSCSDAGEHAFKPKFFSQTQRGDLVQPHPTKRSPKHQSPRAFMGSH